MCMMERNDIDKHVVVLILKRAFGKEEITSYSSPFD